MAPEVTDDALMNHLRALATVVDPVPEDVRMASRSAIAYRDIDARLAELVEEPEMAGVGMRGDQDQWFTFEVDDIVIELAVQTRAGARHLVGQVDGAEVASAAVRQAGSEQPVDVDELGRFSTPIVAGPVSVVIHAVDGPRIATSWIIAPSA